MTATHCIITLRVSSHSGLCALNGSYRGDMTYLRLNDALIQSFSRQNVSRLKLKVPQR